VSMDATQVASARTACQSLHADEAIRRLATACGDNPPMRLALPFAAALLLAACATPRAPVTTTGPSIPPPAAVATVPERYITLDNPDDELDSLATWPTEDGGTWLIATAKNTHELVVFDAEIGRAHV